MRLRTLVATALTAALAGGCSDRGEFTWPEYAAGTGGSTGLRPVSSRPTGETPVLLPDRPALADYLAYAAEHNAGLEAQFYRWRAALERVPQAKALPEPQFTYRYFIVPQAMRDGNMRNVFEVSQMLPWLEKLALRGELAARDAAAEGQRLDSARLKLFYQVKQAYYDYSHLARTLDVMRENLRLLEYVEDVVRARYRTAAATGPEVIRVQTEVARLGNDLKTMEDMRPATVARLNAAMNRPSGAPLPWPTDAVEPTVSASDEQMLEWLSRANPELRALDHDIAGAGKAVELARKEYLPDIMLGVEYDDMRRAVGVMEMPMDPLAVMVTVNLPIWLDKYAAGVREARARRAAALAQKVQTVNALSADLKLAAYRFRDAQRRLGLYGQGLVPKAREAFKATEAAYRTGGSTFSDLIDAQRVLLEFQLEYHRALTERAQNLAELEMLVGREIPRTLEPTTRPEPTTRAD